MGTITRNCPHCHSRNSTFTSFADFRDPNKVAPQVFITPFHCGSCHGGYFCEIEHRSGNQPSSHSGNIEQAQGLRILKEYPKPEAVEAPGYLPKNIESFFMQSAESLTSGNLDASAMMARKTLEVAVKTLDPNFSGTLYKRIEQLHSAGKITDELKNWAHLIRDDGNEAAHEEEPVTKEFADELLSFTELFLMYTFTMPGMVREKKGESEKRS